MNKTDLVGKKFGRLKVICFARGKTTSVWVCKCDCGKCIHARRSNLISGNTKSCGCLNLEKIKERVTTHGRTKTKEHRAWLKMKERCLNPKHDKYQYYGGKGVKIYPPWIRSFEAFFDYIGKAPSKNHSIGRIDNAIGYFPGNVRWETRIQQANNKSSNVIIEYNGESATLKQWARKLDMNYAILHSRIRIQKWTVEKAFNTPARHFTPRPA